MNKYICVYLLSLLLFACNDNSHTKIIITGSSTVAPLANDIASRYESLNKNIRIDVQTGGSSRGINDARKKLSNIGMVSRQLKETETDLQAHTIAWDGITIITHQNNPVASLTNTQIIDIYTGKITNWQQLGGEAAEIVVVNKSAGHSTLGLFLDYFDLKNSDVKADIIIGDNQQGLKTVAGNPLAIAYVSVGAATFEVDNGTSIRLLPINGIAATVDNIANRRFPLSRPLNLVTLGESSDTVKQFLSFAQSEDVNDLVKQQFFIPANAN